MNKKSLFPISYAYMFVSIVFLFFVYYAFNANYNVLQGDQWRWVKSVLIPYYEQDKTLIESLLYEYKPLKHSHILTIGTLMLNAHFFDLSLHLDTLIGVISVGGLILLFSTIISNTQSNASTLTRSIVLVLSALTLMSFSARAVFGWSLVTFEFLYLFIAVLYGYCFIRFLQGQAGYWVVAFTAFVYFLGDAMGVAMVLASVVMSFIYLFIERRSFPRAFCFLSTLFVLIYFSFNIDILSGRPVHAKQSTIESLQYLLVNFDSSIEMFVKGFSRSFFNVPASKLPVLGFLLRDLSIFLGGGAIVFAMISLFYIYRDKLGVAGREQSRFDTDSWFCVQLMLFAAVCIFGVLVTRLIQFDVNYIFGHRYVRFASVFGVAALIAFIKAPFSVRMTNYINIFLIGCIVINLLLLGVSQFIYTKHSEKFFLVRIDALHNGTFGQFHRRCENSFCDEAIEFLKKEKLNQFSD